MIKIYQIEKATKNDLEDIRKVLWSAFDRISPLEKFELSEWFKDFNHYYSLVIRDKGEIVSNLCVRFYEATIRGVDLTIGGIGDVATDPLYRNRGFVRELTIQAFKEMKEQGIVISTLHPFKMSFYEKFGFATVETIDRYDIKAENFRELPLAEGMTIHELTDPKEASILDALQRTMSRFGSMVYFRMEELEKLIETPNCYLIKQNGNPIGWVKFWIYSVGFAREKLATNFCAFKTNEALQAIVHLMRVFALEFDATSEFNYDGVPCMWEGIPNIPIQEFVKDRFALKVQRVGGFMIRVIDFQKYCELIKIPANVEKTVVIEINDRFCDWNSGIWKLTPKNGKLIITKTNDKSEISIDDLMLSRIIGGLTPAKTLLAVGLIHCSQETAKNLEAIFPQEYFYVWNRDL